MPNDNNTLQTALGTVGSWTVSDPKRCDPRNPFFTEATTLHLLLIMVKLVEISFLAVTFLTKACLRVIRRLGLSFKGFCSSCIGYFFKKKPNQKVRRHAWEAIQARWGFDIVWLVLVFTVWLFISCVILVSFCVQFDILCCVFSKVCHFSFLFFVYYLLLSVHNKVLIIQ